jgi:CRISPR-associated endonuclease/helicase Cas3
LITRLDETSRKEPELSFTKMLALLESDDATKSLLAKTLKPKPAPFPRAMDVHGLFTNEPDAFGGFTDISRYVRGEDRNGDTIVFWRNWNLETDDLADFDGPPFSREEGCPVPIHRLRDFLGDKGYGWIWNSKTEVWERALFPECW